MDGLEIQEIPSSGKSRESSARPNAHVHLKSFPGKLELPFEGLGGWVKNFVVTKWAGAKMPTEQLGRNLTNSEETKEDLKSRIYADGTAAWDAP